MEQSRRELLTKIGGIAGILSTASIFSVGMAFQREPQPIPSPNAPNASYPPGLNNAGVHPDSDKKTVDPQIQQEIREDVQKLYALATELRDEVAKTDSNAVFSLSVVKKAEQVEKLAKKVKNLSKG